MNADKKVFADVVQWLMNHSFIRCAISNMTFKLIYNVGFLQYVNCWTGVINDNKQNLKLVRTPQIQSEYAQ